jgi:hypothetical protein
LKSILFFLYALLFSLFLSFLFLFHLVSLVDMVLVLVFDGFLSSSFFFTLHHLFLLKLTDFDHGCSFPSSHHSVEPLALTLDNCCFDSLQLLILPSGQPRLLLVLVSQITDTKLQIKLARALFDELKLLAK